MNPLLGRTLAGRYRVEAPIGRGGMAEVYKVWDEQRAVYLAMKLLREDIAQDRIFLRRFKREAQTLSNLQHPNIVRFYGLEQDGLLAFMLMDYVEGSTLRAEIFQADGQPFPLEKAIEIIRPICSALHYAHGQGRVHCDVKPGNIMLRHNGDVLLADFGIARMTDAATATMIGAGTPAYMAPEQVKGQDPTPRTDIYALGVVLFEMLTGGERPFTGERATITGTTGEKVRWEQMNLDPPDPLEYNPTIDEGIATLLGECLSKDPAKRPGSVLDVLNWLTGAAAALDALADDLEDGIIITEEPAQILIQDQAAIHQSREELRDELSPWKNHKSPDSIHFEPQIGIQKIAAFVFGEPYPLQYPGTNQWITICVVSYALSFMFLLYGSYMTLFAIQLSYVPLIIGKAIALRLKPQHAFFWAILSTAALLLPSLFLFSLGLFLGGVAIGFTQSFFFHKPLNKTWLWIFTSAIAISIPTYLAWIFSSLAFIVFGGIIYAGLSIPVLKRLTVSKESINA